ncbi:TetR/AcrR family transcriptional regulator [Paenibacillus sp. NPDC056722]|uniref:TetR/AcrR family transcriptional regulator n=1 Tax=Paenibacillus sp. NPDC056722 TaxID=3345924 RepID=UPI00368697DD
MDRRILKTRSAIKKAFIELMAEKKFEEITINQISERANLNRGTIYLHYMDKYNLLEKCIEEHSEVLRGLCVPENHEDHHLPIRDSLLRAFEYIEKHYLFYYSMLNNKGLFYFWQNMQQMMMQGISSQISMDRINQHANKEILVRFLTSAAVGVVEWWIMNEIPYSAEEIADEIWLLLERNQVQKEIV